MADPPHTPTPTPAMNHLPRLIHPAFLLITAALLLPPAARADDTDLLTRLNDPSYAVREDATGELLADESITDDRLLALLQAADTEEQRQRLLAVARHHALRRARLKDFPEDTSASLGVSHSAEVHTGNADRPIGSFRIVRTLPGFPGHSHLRAGDLIIAIDGQSFLPEHDSQVFNDTISRFPSGHRVTLRIRRAGRTFDLPVRLAAKAALQAMYDASIGLNPRYQTIWQQAREQLIAAIPDPPVLDTTAGADAS